MTPKYRKYWQATAVRVKGRSGMLKLLSVMAQAKEGQEGCSLPTLALREKVRVGGALAAFVMVSMKTAASILCFIIGHFQGKGKRFAQHASGFTKKRRNAIFTTEPASERFEHALLAEKREWTPSRFVLGTNARAAVPGPRQP